MKLNLTFIVSLFFVIVIISGCSDLLGHTYLEELNKNSNGYNNGYGGPSTSAGLCCKCVHANDFLTDFDKNTSRFFKECNGGINNPGWRNLPEQKRDCITNDYVETSINDLFKNAACPVNMKTRMHIVGHSYSDYSADLFQYCWEVVKCNQCSIIDIDITHSGCSTFSNLDNTMSQAYTLYYDMYLWQLEHPGELFSFKIKIRANQLSSASTVEGDIYHKTLTEFVISDSYCAIKLNLPKCSEINLDEYTELDVNHIVNCLDENGCEITKKICPSKIENVLYEGISLPTIKMQLKSVSGPSDKCAKFCGITPNYISFFTDDGFFKSEKIYTFVRIGFADGLNVLNYSGPVCIYDKFDCENDVSKQSRILYKFDTSKSPDSACPEIPHYSLVKIS